MKKCPKCGEVRGESEFSKQKRNGLQSYCKKCSAVMHKELYQFYKERKICVLCGRSGAVIGLAVCRECSDKRNAYRKARYKKFKQGAVL